MPFCIKGGKCFQNEDRFTAGHFSRRIGNSPLSTKSRNALGKKSFALPGKRAYPINDANHARNALARVAQHGTAAEKAAVRKAVHRKYPNIGK